MVKRGCVIFLILWILFMVAIIWTKCANAADVDDMEEYIHHYNSKVDAHYVADVIYTVFHDEYNQDPWLWTIIIRRESNFNTSAISPSGKHFHWPQLARSHKRHFKDYNLTWMDDYDMCRYAAIMVQNALDSGESIYNAYSPWAVRSRAFREYKQMFGHKP